jgi:hypothetical protein
MDPAMRAGTVFQRLKVGAVMSAQPSFAYRHSLLASSEVEPTPRPAIRSLEVSLGASTSGPSDERRRHARIPLTLQGRYMLEDGSEFACETQDISPIGIGIRGFSAGAIGDRVIAYFEGLGRVEGRIVRRAHTWFAIDIIATPRKLESLANKINRLVENGTKGG